MTRQRFKVKVALRTGEGCVPALAVGGGIAMHRASKVTDHKPGRNLWVLTHEGTGKSICKSHDATALGVLRDALLEHGDWLQDESGVDAMVNGSPTIKTLISSLSERELT